MNAKISFRKYVTQRAMQFTENQQKISDALSGCRVTLMNGRYRAIGITTAILNYLAWEAEFAANVPMKILYIDSRPPPVHVLGNLGYISDRYKDHYRVGKNTTLDIATFKSMESKFRGYSQPYDIIVAEDIMERDFIKLFELIEHTTGPERKQYIYQESPNYWVNPSTLYKDEPVKVFYRERPRIIASAHDYEPIEEFLISWYNALNKDEDDQSLALIPSFNERISFMNDPNYRPY